MAVSVKTENEGSSGKTVQIRGAKAGGEVSPVRPCTVFDGYSPVAFRPPHPWPRAGYGAAASSFFSFDRDPHDLFP